MKRLLLILLCLPMLGVGQILINEYTGANYDTYTDNYGEYEDWVELYNPTATAIDISGWYLSDKVHNPTKWMIPSSFIIPSNGTAIVYCSGRDELVNGNAHSNFKITQTKANEVLILSDSASVLQDSIRVLPNQNSHTRGRETNGAANWSIFTTGTPNANNTGAMQEYATTPIFSQVGGYNTAPVNLSLNSPDPNITIYYTTNGDQADNTSTIYSGPINIATTSVVKAIAYSSDPDIPPSFIDYHTFFINDTHTIPILSVSGDAVDNLLNGSGGLEPTGAIEWFDENGILLDKGTGEFNKHGNDSWAYNQRGFDYIMRDQFGYNYALKDKIFMTKDRDKFQRIILKAAANDNYPASNGGAHIRDSYVHHLSQLGDLRMDERSYTSCIVYVNGDYWGVYDLREKVDDHDFTDYYYNQDKNNLQYLKTWGQTWAEYGGSAAENDWNTFKNWVLANPMLNQANYNQAKSEYNTGSLIDYFLLNSYVVCSDWLNWNTAWWRGMDPNGDKKKWRYTLWDMDATFDHYINYTGVPSTSATAEPCDPSSLNDPGGQGHVPIWNELLTNQEFHDDYINRWQDLANGPLSCSFMVNLLDSMITVIDPEMPRHISTWGGTYTGWQNNVTDLRDFILARCDSMNSGFVSCDTAITDIFDVTVEIIGIGEVEMANNNIINELNTPWTDQRFGGILLPFKVNSGSFDYWEIISSTTYVFDPYVDTLAFDLQGDVTVRAYFTSPSWDCDPSTGSCYDPGTGSGIYVSQFACQSNCGLSMTYVPDDNFENYLEANGMGDGIALNDSVFTANINTVTSLNVGNQSISDLTGIEDFIDLTYLTCASNNLTSLDVSNNLALTNLSCGYNQLTSLDVSGSTALSFLNCDNNQLTSLDVNNNTALTSLYCANNQLTTLDVNNHPLLSGLVCNNNQLTSLNVSGAFILSVLYCSNNQLTSLDVSSNSALENLACSSNQLISLDVRNGNNWQMLFNALNNPNLFCINVDDSTYSTNNWMNIDPQSYFSNNCPSLCQLSIVPTNVLCNGQNNGSVFVQGTGIIGSYNYVLQRFDSPFPGWNSFLQSPAAGVYQSLPVTFPLLSPDSFRVIMTDSTGCSDTATFNLTEPTEIDLTVVSSNPETCRGGDGSLQISAVGGSAPYYYSIDGGLSFNQTPFVFLALIDSLSSGMYSIIVTDTNLCISNSTFPLLGITPNPIIDSVTIIKESCCGGDGQIIVFADNPSTIVKYSIDTLSSWQDSSVFVGLYSGDYLVHIEDANACIDSVTVVVGFETETNINMATQVNDIICYGDTNGRFKVLEPDACYDYFLWQWTIQSVLTIIDTGVYFNELIKGNYGVIAISKSGHCEVDSSIEQYIDEPSLITYNQPTSSAVYCINNGLCNGSISLDGLPTGGIPPYQYYVHEVYTNIPLGLLDVDSTFFGICPGEYEVEVVDANSCVIRDTILVLDSSLYIDSFVVENSSCFGYGDGAISVYAHGGVGAYSYSWSNGDITQTADSLFVDSYSVIVSDSVACLVIDSAVIVQPEALLFNVIGKIPETCMGVTNDGQILLEIIGGTSPYNSSWVGNSGISGSGFGDIITSLTYDTITISVYDANGCIASPVWLTADIALVDALNAVSPLKLDSVLIGNSPMCFGSADGTIQINIDQGVAPYSYSIDNGVTQISADTFFNLIALPYDIVVYDVFGCSESTQVLLEEYDEFSIGVESIKHVDCYGDSSGHISVRASDGGIAPFNYFWVPTLDTTASITNLSAASYMVKLTDSAGCMVSDTIILEHLTAPIQSIDLMISHANCFGAEDGSASMQIIGGMPFGNGTYTISWMDSNNVTIANGDSAYNLSAGTYLVEIIDSFFCGPVIDTIVITQPSQFYLDVIDIKDNVCFGDASGEISVTAFGGTPPYINYFIDDDLNDIASSDSSIFTDLAASDYSLWSVDTNDCYSDTLFGVILTQPAKIYIDTNSIKVTDVSCFQSADGKIELSILSGTSPYQYQLLDGNTVLTQGNVQDTLLFYDLAAINFTIRISDAHACEIDTQIIVNQPDEVVASFVVDDDLGSKSFTVAFENLSLGADIFVWDFSDGDSENTNYDDVVHTFVNQGEYVVELIAYNSGLSDLCSDTVSLIINVDGYDVFNAFSPNNDNINDVFSFDDWMFKEINVEIFNRWGQQVFHWIGSGKYWDGKGYNGEKLAEGVYFYIMNAKAADGSSFREKGSVTLFR